MKLVVFDMDGTLIDSQAHIAGAMARAFDAVGRDCPQHADILGIVGLSLPQAMARLLPEARLGTALNDQLVAAYKDSFASMRVTGAQDQASPLYPGAREVLDRLAARDDMLLGVATGKSRRGLRHVFAAHDLAPYFVTTQVADDHPSKPAPNMLMAAMDEAGAQPRDTVIIGDTSFDMEMGRNAGVRRIGVSWGYHPRAALTAAEIIIDQFAALETALQDIWRPE